MNNKLAEYFELCEQVKELNSKITECLLQAQEECNHDHVFHRKWNPFTGSSRRHCLECGYCEDDRGCGFNSGLLLNNPKWLLKGNSCELTEAQKKHGVDKILSPVKTWCHGGRGHIVPLSEILNEFRCVNHR